MEDRQAVCLQHYSTMTDPFFDCLEPAVFIVDILHLKLTIVPKLWRRTVTDFFGEGDDALKKLKKVCATAHARLL